jgi:hypothetical protein
MVCAVACVCDRMFAVRTALKVLPQDLDAYATGAGGLDAGSDALLRWQEVEFGDHRIAHAILNVRRTHHHLIDWHHATRDTHDTRQFTHTNTRTHAHTVTETDLRWTARGARGETDR